MDRFEKTYIEKFDLPGMKYAEVRDTGIRLYGQPVLVIADEGAKQNTLGEQVVKDKFKRSMKEQSKSFPYITQVENKEKV